MVSDNLLLPGIAGSGEAIDFAPSIRGMRLEIGTLKQQGSGSRKRGRRPEGALSCADQVYFALRYWGALRRQTLLKLVPVSNESLKVFARPANKSGPATVLSGIMSGRSVKIVRHDTRKRPETLGGDVWIRNPNYVPEQKSLNFPLKEEPELFSEGFLKRNFEGSGSCNRILRRKAGMVS